jgi:hypothetical protein
LCPWPDNDEHSRLRVSLHRLVRPKRHSKTHQRVTLVLILHQNKQCICCHGYVPG